MAFYEENPGGITKADMVLAIPTLDEAETVNFTTKQAAKGLAEYFGGIESVIVNCDNHSTDGTKESFFCHSHGNAQDLYFNGARKAGKREQSSQSL